MPWMRAACEESPSACASLIICLKRSARKWSHSCIRSDLSCGSRRCPHLSLVTTSSGLWAGYRTKRPSARPCRRRSHNPRQVLDFDVRSIMPSSRRVSRGRLPEAARGCCPSTVIRWVRSSYGSPLRALRPSR
jgi:hypothetical protein